MLLVLEEMSDFEKDLTNFQDKGLYSRFVHMYAILSSSNIKNTQLEFASELRYPENVVAWRK